MLSRSFGLAEKDIQQFIANDTYAQKQLKNILGIEEIDVNFKREETFINGITVDLMIHSRNNKSIYSLIECKGSNINVTDYVRGIGQTLQYEYFYEEKIPPKNEHSYNFNSKFKTVLLITSDFMKLTNINLSKFKYPETVTIIEINTHNYKLREIDKEEIKKINDNTDLNTIALNFYYFRDNRIFELYILLKELTIESLTSEDSIHRKEMEKRLVKEKNVINNGNWRNAFITLSSLGFIDSNNRPTELGFSLTQYTFEEFAFYVYENYLKDYIDLLLMIIEEKELQNKRISEITKEIYNYFNGKEVLYLTQSNNRYISSFLNIMRDDYGILSFEPRSSNRVINYDIRKYNKKNIIDNIRNRTVASKYL